MRQAHLLYAREASSLLRSSALRLAVGATALTLSLFSLTSLPSLASTVINLSSSHAEGRSGQIPSLTVWQGSGLTINFSGTDERIVKAWLDDPSRLTMDFDAPLCTGQRSANCSGVGATAIHLKRIHQLNFPQLPSTPKTLLTVVVEGTQGRKTYYFTLGYGGGTAKYIAANVNTDPRPAIREQETRETALNSRAERVERGLAIARQRNTSQKNELVFERVEMLLAFVRGGMSFPDATRRVNISPSVLHQLESLTTASGGQS